MKDFLRKLRECDKWVEAVHEDPNFAKVLAEGNDGERDIEIFMEFKRTIVQMRASARMQINETKDEPAGA